MSETNQRRRRLLTIASVYFLVVGSVLGFNLIRARAVRTNPFDAKQPETTADTKPFFSLSTHRTFAPGTPARLWTSYQAVDFLDFRVYRLKDPAKFFKQLEDPHQIGEDEKSEVSNTHRNRPSVLERTHAVKSFFFSAIKDYVRGQLKRDHREVFNQKFRQQQEEPSRTPLNIADYARVPLLNPEQLVSSWREKLTPIAQYDRRMISLGRREPGVYLVEAVNGNLRAYSIAIVTDLAMVQKTSRDGEVLVYVVNRKTGAPQPGANVEFVSGNQSLASGVTDKSGLLKQTVKSVKSESVPAEDQDPEDESAQRSYLILARSGENFAISDLDSFYFSRMDEEESESDPSITGYVYTDRPVYRPAQHVYFKGILRRWTNAGYELIGQKAVTVTVEDPDNGKVFERELPLSARGTFSGELDLGDESPLGSYQVRAAAGNVKANGYFVVQEYKKPEFKVKVGGPQQFAAVGEQVKFNIDARYFFGAPVTNADVHYYVTRSRYYHWWWGEGDEDEADDETGSSDDEDAYDGAYYSSGDIVTEGDGTLDARGRMTVEFEVPEPDEKDQWDYRYGISAQVTDSSRREMQGSASFVGTRGKTVADARAERYLYYQGDNARIRVRTATYDGHPVAETVTLKFTEQKWERIEKEEEYNGYKYKTYDYVSHVRELGSTSVTTNAQGEAAYDFPVPSPGYIFITAVTHENGREIVTHGGSFWAPDRTGTWSDFDYRYSDENGIKLVPDKKSYQPGETAHVLAMLPQDQAHLLVTTELSSVLTMRQIDSPGRSVVIDVPIDSNCEPNVFLSVAFVRDDDMYSESKMISVPARSHMMKLDIIANKPEYKPRETASYTIVARNADGSPAAGAEVSLGVVDEAIYSIEPESAGNIKREFFGRRYNEVETTLAIQFSFTGYSGDKPIELASTRPAYQLADFKSDSPMAEPTIRREFKDTAFWQPEVITGNDGKATVKVKLPDNLTTWRATARGITTDTHVGSAVQKVIARKDVIMRLEMPRFLTQGDNVTISGVVHNFLKAGKSTRISLELSGAQLLSPATETVTIASNGEHRVDWRVNAPQVGQLRLLAKALTDTESDAVEMTLDIVPHGLKQTAGAVTTLTQNDADQTLSLNLPANPDSQARSLRIEAAPSIAGALFGALDYLTSFPYGCTEQTMSSFLPNVIVSQALKDVPNAKIRATNDLPKKVQRGLDRLYSYQHEDGGWGWWKDDPTDAFMTAYVVDGLTLARGAGFQVEEWRLNRGREKLLAIIDANKEDGGNPIDPETRAYMIYALISSGDADAKYLEQLYANHEKLQPYGRALLALALKQRGDDRAGEVAAEIESSARVNDFDAHWETHRLNHYGRPLVLDIETTALSLKALARITPQSPLLSKSARWLVNNRRNGYYWLSTKETAFALYGLSDYLKVSKELEPNYTFEVYLNGQQIMLQHVGQAEVAAAKSFVITRRAGDVGTSNSIRIVKHGRGALYLSSALEYFTADEEVQPHGSSDLKVTREYFRLLVTENEQGKKKWTLEPLSGDLHSGDLIVSRLHIEGGRAQYVMIEDPIPAGCEQVARLDGLTFNYTEHDWSDWYSSREFRDNRTVLFLNQFDGNATFKYAMRVEVPGEFRVAPARVELMYEPTVQANTGNSRLTILDKK